MALAYPLPLAGFLDTLGVKQVTFALREAVRMSPTQGGELLRADVGTRLWGGRVVVGVQRVDEIERAAARVELLQQAGASFLVTRVHADGPAQDPTGALLGAAAPVITAVAANGRDLAISGLPANYRLSQGDLLAWTYGNPARQALHRVVADRTATAGGLIAQLEVSPFVEPGLAANAPLQLLRPACKAVMVPGSYQPPEKEGRHTYGLSFEWRQTLR